MQAGGHEFESHHLHDDNESCRTGKTQMRRARTGADVDLLDDRTTVRDEIARRAMNPTDTLTTSYLEQAHACVAMNPRFE